MGDVPSAWSSGTDALPPSLTPRGEAPRGLADLTSEALSVALGGRGRAAALVDDDASTALPLQGDASLDVRFDVTDGAATVSVAYNGILPDLFREGQGIISVGQLNEGGLFQASEVLAKHDENYMPPEVADSMKNGGHMPLDYKNWQKKP